MSAWRRSYIGDMALFQAKHLRVQPLGEGILLLVLNRHQSSSNLIDLELLAELDRALDAIHDARLLVIRSTKAAGFAHGPSPALVASWNKDQFRTWCERGQQVCTKLAQLSVPSTCIIAGPCLDAGLELALACDHRIVIDSDSTELGFPALEWGLIPCWGTTQRLPHLVGLDESFEMLLGAERHDAREAWRRGLADEVIDEKEEDPPSFLANPAKRDWSTFPARTFRQSWLESNRPGRWFLFRGADRIVRTRVPEEMPAPAEMLEGLRIAYQASDPSTGLVFERAAMEHIVEHPALGHLTRMLMQREKLRAPGIATSEKTRIRHVGVVGGGVAGLSAIIHSVTRGYDVVLRAEDEMALGAGLTQTVQLLQREVQEGKMELERFQKLMGAIRGTYTWTHFDKLDLVVDTAAGSLEEKRRFYRDLETHIPATSLIVSTSFAHRVEDLREGLKRPQQMVGLRLIEPWSRGSFGELVVPPGVTPHTVQRVRDWANAIGKTCLPTTDQIGGVVMRVWLPALNEAGLLVKEGVPIERVDRAMRRFGMTFGPCEWMDRLGIDLIALLALRMKTIFGERIRFETGFSLMTENQWLGNKTGQGFYRAGFRKRNPCSDAQRLWQTESQGEAAKPVPALSDADTLRWIQRRLVTLTVLEALRCVQEGWVKDADDLDCALCLTGWATHRGGPIGFARQLGVESLKAQCTELSQQYGLRFAPLASFRELLQR